MRLGRGAGRRTLQTPTNYGLAGRAEARLAATADAYAAQVETALAVDGVPLIIWNKGLGRYPCACTAGEGIFSATEVTQSASTDVQQTSTSTGKPKRGGFTAVDSLFENDSGDGTSTGKFKSSPRDRILKQDTQDVRNAGIDYSRDSISPFADSSGDPLDDALLSMGAADDLLSEKIITCPICMGTGLTDSWQPNNGVRLPLDLSARFETEMNNVDIVETAVPKFELEGSQTIEWSINLPATWLILARAALYNDEVQLPFGSYNMTITLPDSNAYPFTEQVLRSLKGNAVVTEGPVKFKLQALPGQVLVATHFDLIYLMAKPTRGQLPEIEIPYEDEYVDWNLNISIELSPKAQIKEGSYVVDAKYKRVWKVDSYSKKQLANGQIYGYTATLRALHSFEKLFTLFNIFAK